MIKVSGGKEKEEKEKKRKEWEFKLSLWQIVEREGTVQHCVVEEEEEDMKRQERTPRAPFWNFAIHTTTLALASRCRKC